MYTYLSATIYMYILSVPKRENPKPPKAYACFHAPKVAPPSEKESAVSQVGMSCFISMRFSAIFMGQMRTNHEVFFFMVGLV